MDRYEIIRRAVQKHGYKYNYSKICSTLIKSKQTIICPIHGEFTQSMDSHINVVEVFVPINLKTHLKLL